jgi:uncharacterized RDD family membrane protein YckC
VSDLPSYPEEAAEREATQPLPGGERQYAGWGRRLAAYLIDGLLLAIPIAIAFVVVIASSPGEDDDGAWAVLGIAYLITLVLPFVYFTVMHGGERGQTFAKRWLGIRVTSDGTGGSIGHGRAFGRYAIQFVFWIFFIPAVLDYLWPLWDTKNQALHDKVVGSVVVRA